MVLEQLDIHMKKKKTAKQSGNPQPMLHTKYKNELEIESTLYVKLRTAKLYKTLK